MAKPRIEIELTTKGASAVQKTLGNVMSTVKSWAAGLGAVVGAAFSVRELTRGLQEAINTLDTAGASAQKAGVAVQELSTLGYAATISKANVEQLQVGLKFLNRSIHEAAEGAKQYTEAYQSLGVTVRNEDGTLRSTNQVLLDLADRFAQMPNGAQKTALALQLLGRSGSELIPFLNQGSDAIRQLQEEARVFGVEVTPQAAQAAGDFNDNLQRLGYAAQGMFQQIAAELLPSLVALTDRIVAAAKASQALGVVGRALSAVLKEVAWYVVGAAEAVKVLATAFDILTDYLSVPLFALGRFAGALKDLAGVVVSSVGEMLRHFEALGTIMGLVFARQFTLAASVAKSTLKDLTVSTATATAEIAKGVAQVVGTISEVNEYAAETHSRAMQKWSDALDATGAALMRFEWDVENPRPPSAALQAPAFEAGEFDSVTLIRQRTKLELESQAQTLADRRLATQTDIARLETNRHASDTERYRQTLAWRREELALVEEHIRKLKERLEIEQDEQTRQLLTQQIRQAERDQAGLGTAIARQEYQGDPSSVLEQLGNAADDMARRIGTVAQQIARSFTEVVGSAINTVADNLTDVVMRTKSWADALREIGATILRSVVQAIIRMGVEYVAAHVLMRGAMLVTDAIQTAIGVKRKAENTASFVSGASAGVGQAASQGGWVGILIYLGVLAAALAAVAGMAGGFAEGGLVHGKGGPKEDRVLARLSPGEYVIPAERVRQYGTEFFERIREGKLQGAEGSPRLFEAGDRLASALATVNAMAQGGLVQALANGGLVRASNAGGRAQALAQAFAEGGAARGMPAGDTFLARLQNRFEGLRDYGQPALQAVDSRLTALTAETGLRGAATAGSTDAAPGSTPADPSKVNLSLVLVDSRNQARQFLESAEGEARLIEIIRRRRMQVGIPT